MCCAGSTCRPAAISSASQRTIRRAGAAGGRGADVLWHAAVIYATNDPSHGAAELSAAFAADPSLANRDDVQKMSRQLSAGRNAAAR